MSAPSIKHPPLRGAVPALGCLLLFLLGNDGQCLPADGPGGGRPAALVLPDRSAHLLDRPYPSDELLTADGTVALEGFPLAGPVLGQSFMQGWLSQLEAAVRGFSAVTPIYFRFDGPIPNLAPRYESAISDPVRLYSLDSFHRVPVNTRFVEDPSGDPYLRSNLLVLRPDERHPLRSGERYAAIVSRALALPAPGSLPAELAGTNAAIGTVFTAQDPVTELAALRVATDAFLDADPSLLVPDALREVESVRYEQGTTPSGQPSTVETVTFVGGDTETTFLNDKGGVADSDIDVTGGPMRVYQATIQTVAFQDPVGRPYQSPGLGIILDTTRTDGWIDFDATGALLATPQAEPMRIVIQVPRSGTDHAIVVWGHGSGGDAYEAIGRIDPANDVLSIRTAVADAGALLVSHDQPLFGRRFALIDSGYESNLAIVNIPNLPAFRDNVRQGAVDKHVLLRFVTEVLPDLFDPGVVDAARVGSFGHSIGAQLGDVALGLYPDGDGPAAMLSTGTGGFQVHAVLAADLLDLSGDIATLIFQLAGVQPPADAAPNEVFGALFGVPQAAWDGIDRFHPLALPFQTALDAGDPLPVANEHPTPRTVFRGEEDGFVPPEAAAWLADATPEGTLVDCIRSGDYDGHTCVFREPAGVAAFEALVDSL